MFKVKLEISVRIITQAVSNIRNIVQLSRIVLQQANLGMTEYYELKLSANTEKNSTECKCLIGTLIKMYLL